MKLRLIVTFVVLSAVAVTSSIAPLNPARRFISLLFKKEPISASPLFGAAFSLLTTAVSVGYVHVYDFSDVIDKGKYTLSGALY